MELYDIELDQVRKILASRGVAPDDFRFERIFLPPESEDGAMFTVRYDVRSARADGGATLVATGGIGLDWVARFERALDEGFFVRRT